MRGRFSVANPSTSNGFLGAVVQVSDTNEAELITGESDPLSVTAEWIERMTTMWQEQFFLPPKDAEGPTPYLSIPIDIKVSRRIENPRGIFLTVRSGAATTMQYHFWLRTLMRIGVK